jgi:ATP-dependent Clp protease ATP-binding subunit ClpA
LALDRFGLAGQDFRNTIIIMTSNIKCGTGLGAASLRHHARQDNTGRADEGFITNAENLPPELLNRLDDVNVFNRWTKKATPQNGDNSPASSRAQAPLPR